MFAGKPVFCLGGTADNVVAVVHDVGGIVAEGNNFRQAGVLLKVINMRDVVQIDNRAEFQSLAEFFGGRIVGSQNNFFARDAGRRADIKFGD